MGEASLEGKVMIVTGGSRGMGRELAVAFAAAGAKGVVVTATAASDETEAEIEAELNDVVAAIEGTGSPGLALSADVTSFGDCERVVRRTVETFGALHVLINNAGKNQRYHGGHGLPFWKGDHDGWRLVLETNAVGPYFMAKAAVPEMLAGGWGRVVNVTKNADQMHEARTGAYGPSKAALEAASVSWAEELAGTGVTVNVVLPGGLVDTKFPRGSIRNKGLHPNVLVPIALWLASPASDDVTGCRFNGSLWDADLPAALAAEACREGPLFPVPTRPTKLDRAWRLRAPSPSGS